MTTEFTPGDVVRFKNCRGVHLVDSAHNVVPTSCINMDSSCYLINIDILMSEPQPANMNVVILANASEPTINVNITAQYPLINGNNTKVQTIRKSSIRQVVSASTPDVSTAIYKEGRPEWTWGHVFTNGTNEDFYFRGNGQNFLTFRLRGADIPNSYRELIPSGHMQLGSAYNSKNLLKLGNYTLCVNASGKLMVKNGHPTSDTDGTVIGTQA